MELEELKKGWKEMGERMDKIEKTNDELLGKITQNRATSARQRLKREYQMMTAVCFMAPSWLAIAQRNMEELGDWIVYLFLVFFLVMAANKGFVWWKLSRMDYQKMTIKEALISTYQLEKYQKRGTLIGIGLAIPLLVCFMVNLYLMHEVYAFYGAWLGLVFGLWLGLRIHRRIKKEIKEMRDALQDELN
ncbi:hypothetical protein [Phocaeicola sp.]